MVFSITFRQPATAALAAIAVWLFFMVFWPILSGLLAQMLQPVEFGALEEILTQAESELTLSRLSPNTLYSEVMLALLQPTIRSVGLVLPIQLHGAVLGSPLHQSLLLVWPE